MTKVKISITINEKTLHDIESIIDSIYIRNRSQAIEHLVKNVLGENKTAVILLGGSEENLRISKEVYRPTAKIKNSSVNNIYSAQMTESRSNKMLIKYKIPKHVNDV